MALTRHTLPLQSTSALEETSKKAMRSETNGRANHSCAWILTNLLEEISLLILSAIPGNIVEPPLRTMLPYKSFLISTSHFMMELYVVSWMPAASIPIIDGWKRTSGQRKRSAPMVMTCPSGNS
uniref:Uncharacterized protein n=1 Tax=Salix viminalis TaxID=40686 RepID=A0A6N2LQY1_SALVM